MTRLSLFLLSAALGAFPAPLPAQAIVQAVPGTTDADRLAGQMRLLASNPTDLSALLAAGELSVKLDDLGAAASFFARADKVDPHNGRAKAGEASILVHAERPGEALRYFALAESYGLAPAAFAADRGLAYDLIGENERAQRDYRLALRTPSASGPDEETQRRYALSLAIAGKRDLAEQQLQPLLRKSDRAAWRARAFSLAMAGNVAEATRIATTMMPPGTAAGLQPFLEKLPSLGPVDRAFAVHFGEVRSTPQRVADARLVPALPALGPDPYAPRVQVAAATIMPADRGKHRKGKDKGREAPVQVAAATPAPEPAPQAPGYRNAVAAPAPVQAPRGVAPTAWPAAVAVPPRGAVAPSLVATAPAPAARVPVTLAAATPSRAPTSTVARPPSAWPTATPLGQPVSRAPVAMAVAPTSGAASVVPSDRAPIVAPAPRPVVVAAGPAVASAPAPLADAGRAAPPAEADVTVGTAAPRSSPTVPLAAAPIPAPAPAAPVMATTADPVALPSSSAPAPLATTEAAAPQGSSTTTEAPLPAAGTAVAARPDPAAPAPPRRHDTGDLSRIVASLPIPASELGVAGPVRAPVAPPAEPPVATPAAPDPAIERAAAAKALADRKAADRKALAEKKALAAKKAAAEEKAEEAREAAAQKKLERANPERIWVQVAGGAYEGDLPKAWAAAKKKGGDVFAGHASGYTTPLRFTNRVLAGPFKTDEEARAFVNKLKAKGLSGFTFTSDAGQVVKKLDSE